MCCSINSSILGLEEAAAAMDKEMVVKNPMYPNLAFLGRVVLLKELEHGD